jgi:hypothetical protein
MYTLLWKSLNIQGDIHETFAILDEKYATISSMLHTIRYTMSIEYRKNKLWYKSFYKLNSLFHEYGLSRFLTMLISNAYDPSVWMVSGNYIVQYFKRNAIVHLFKTDIKEYDYISLFSEYLKDFLNDLKTLFKSDNEHTFNIIHCLKKCIKHIIKHHDTMMTNDVHIKSAVYIQKHMRGFLTRKIHGVHNPNTEKGKVFIRRLFETL